MTPEQQKAFDSAGPYILIDAMHGLGNRLRAYASARAIARKTGRHLIVSWRMDEHCNVAFNDLFSSAQDIAQTVRLTTVAEDYRTLTGPRACTYYDYMKPEDDRPIVDMTGKNNVCIRSAYAIATLPKGRMDDPGKDYAPELKKMRWSPPVVKLMDELQPCEFHSGARPKVIGLHVRMEANMSRDVPGIEKEKDAVTGKAAMDKMAADRQKCHWKSFLPALQRMRVRVRAEHSNNLALSNISANASLKCQRPHPPKNRRASDATVEGPVLLIASDTPETYAAVAEASPLPTLPLQPPAKCSGAAARQTECQQVALAHMLLLSKTHYFIGSALSSFTETVDLLQATSPHLGRVKSTKGCEVNWQPASVKEPLPPAESDGTSVIMACRNRPLSVGLVMKYACNTPAKEIIIVDWTSDVPFDPPKNCPQLKLLRVEGEEKWELSRAVNLAIHEARYDKVLKIDADTNITSAFFDAHPFPPGQSHFYTGNWALARTPEEIHLSGILYARREALMRINGYDERISTYGWDDSDLYERLEASGVARKDINLDTVHHIPHDDSLRANKSVAQPSAYTALLANVSQDFALEVSTQTNRIASQLLGPWSRQNASSMYHLLQKSGKKAVCNGPPPAGDKCYSFCCTTRHSGMDKNSEEYRKLDFDCDCEWSDADPVRPSATIVLRKAFKPTPLMEWFSRARRVYVWKAAVQAVLVRLFQHPPRPGQTPNKCLEHFWAESEATTARRWDSTAELMTRLAGANGVACVHAWSGNWTSSSDLASLPHACAAALTECESRRVRAEREMRGGRQQRERQRKAAVARFAKEAAEAAMDR